MKEHFQIKIKGEEMLGIIDLPPNIDLEQDRVPCVVFCYGLNGNRVDVNRIPIKLGRALNSVGTALVRFDYIGCGVSEGRFSNGISEDRVSQTLEVIQYLKGLKHIDTNKLGIVGFSDGCRIVIDSVISSNVRDNIKSIALWSPVLLMNENASINKGKSENIPSSKVSYREIFKKSKLENTYSISAYGQWINPRYHHNYSIASYSHKTNKLLTQMKSFFIFGGNDDMALATKDYLIKQRACEDSIYTIEEADHVFNKAFWIKQLLEKTTEYFGKTLEVEELK